MIGRQEEQLTVLSTKESMGPPKCMVIPLKINGVRIKEDQQIKARWVMGRLQSTSFIFSGNGWTVDSCMWTGSSLVYGNWLDPNNISKGPLGLIVM